MSDMTTRKLQRKLIPLCTMLKLSQDSIAITAQLITQNRPDTHGRRSDWRSGPHSIGHTYVRE
eukprot:2978161-Ditylum_brightwellii.AAC.1